MRLLIAGFAATLSAIAFLTAASLANVEAGPPYIQGDVDCNEAVDVVDALHVLRSTAELPTTADCLEQAGDVNCDGAVDPLDSLGILRHTATLPPLPAPAGCPPIGDLFGPTPSPAPITPSPPPDSVSPTPTPSPPPRVTPTPTPSPPGPTPTPTPSPPGATPTPTPSPPGATPTPTPIAFTLQQVAPGANFARMLALAAVPGEPDQVIVVTQDAMMWRVSLSGNSEPVLFADLTDRVFLDSPRYEEGLLGLAFSPSFEEDSLAYVYYTGKRTSSLFYSQETLSRFQVTNGLLDTGSEEVLIAIDACDRWHHGGGLKFGPDGYLYLGIGDEGWAFDNYHNGQDIFTLFGSIIRIDVRTPTGYTIPPDNPFLGLIPTPAPSPAPEPTPFGCFRGSNETPLSWPFDGPSPTPFFDRQPTGPDEIYAFGFRNPWRFSFDALTGDLWVGDVGQSGWEEINLVEKGGNHGWSCFEGLADYNNDQCQLDYDLNDPASMAAPLAVYEREGLPGNCAVIGGHVYRGTQLAGLHGSYIFGDFCAGKVWAWDTSLPAPAPNGTVTPDDFATLIVQVPGTISTLAELPNGELVVIDYSGDPEQDVAPALYQIVPAE